MFDHKKPFIEIPGEYVRMSPYDIPVPEGWKTNEGYPNCCGFHSGIQDNVDSFLKKFPLCCEPHKEFAKLWNVTSKDFEYLRSKVVNQISYTEHFIESKITNDDFVEDFGEYIEYNMQSFGNPPIGGDIYLNQLLHYTKTTRFELPKDKQSEIIKILENFLNPGLSVEKTPGLNTLYDIHQKWLRTFPFELSYFAPLKDHFSKKMPFITKMEKTNRYTGLTKAQMHTEASMVEYLMSLTKQLLNLINTKELVQSGKIANVDQPKFEMILQEREVKRKALLEQYNKNERKYIKTIKQWLKDEIEFFGQLKSLDQKVLPKPERTKKPTTKQISFELKYGKDAAVKSILSELNREIYLINEDKTTFEDFWNVISAKHIPIDKEIHFGCYNNQLAYIIDQLKHNKKYFKSLSYSALERAGIFYSKEGSKITGQLLSSSKNQNSIPARKDFIDSLFK